MAVSHLQCKECKAQYPLEALYVCERCFGPLEVAYDHSRSSRDVGELRRRIQGGPQNIWRYADFLPLAGGPPGPSGRLASRVGPAGRLHAADPRRPARRAARPARGVGQERRRQPDALVQGPRRLGRRHAGARARLRDDRLRLDRQPRQLGRRPRRGAGHGLLRLHPRRPRGAEDPRHGRLRHQARRREGQLRRRQPPVHRAVRRARLGVREHQPAPLLRRGLEDAGVRDRRAARLGAARPLRRADRLGLAVHEDRQGLRGVDASSGCSRASCRDERRPGRGLLAGGERVRRRPRRLPAGQAEHDRQVAGDRQPRRRPLRARSRAPHAAARSTRSATRRSARASSCWPRRPASSPRRPAASRRRCSRSSPRAATSTPTSASCW